MRRTGKRTGRTLQGRPAGAAASRASPSSPTPTSLGATLSRTLPGGAADGPSLWSPPKSPGSGVAAPQSPPGPDCVSRHQPVQEPVCVPGTLGPVQGVPWAPRAWGASPTEACTAGPVPAASRVLTETPEALTIHAPGAPHLRKAQCCQFLNAKIAIEPSIDEFMEPGPLQTETQRKCSTRQRPGAILVASHKVTYVVLAAALKRG